MRRAIWMMVCCGVMASSCLAQTGMPATRVDSPRVELFAGYSYWAPHDSVNGIPYKADDQGMIFSGAYFFNRYLGGQLEGERSQQTSNDGLRAFSIGPVFRYPTEQGVTPFVHALVGGAGVTGPNEASTGNGSGFFYNPERWGVLLTAGIGVDYATPLLHHHLSLRVFQADYQYTHVSFGGFVLPTTGGRANINAVRLSTGIVYSFDQYHLPRLRSRWNR
jgi:hypothetical protein